LVPGRTFLPSWSSPTTPFGSLGTRYIVPLGYLKPTISELRHLVERFYLVAAYPNTTVKVYYDSNNASKYTTISLSQAGDATRYTFPSSTTYAVYVESNLPVYVYQRTE
jgi:hypothetical protein